MNSYSTNRPFIGVNGSFNRGWDEALPTPVSAADKKLVADFVAAAIPGMITDADLLLSMVLDGRMSRCELNVRNYVW